MDGMKIINSFKRETLYEFSEAIPILNDNLYFIFKVDIISIDTDPSENKLDKLKELIKNGKNPGNYISHLDLEPIAYLLKTNKNVYNIEAIDERYTKFIEKNKEKLLEDFLNRE